MFDISELNLMNVYEKSYVNTDRRVIKEGLKVLCQKSFLSYDYHQYGENQYQKFNCQRDQFAITKIILENGIQIKKINKQQRFNYYDIETYKGVFSTSHIPSYTCQDDHIAIISCVSVINDKCDISVFLLNKYCYNHD